MTRRPTLKPNGRTQRPPPWHRSSPFHSSSILEDLQPRHGLQTLGTCVPMERGAPGIGSLHRNRSRYYLVWGSGVEGVFLGRHCALVFWSDSRAAVTLTSGKGVCPDGSQDPRTATLWAHSQRAVHTFGCGETRIGGVWGGLDGVGGGLIEVGGRHVGGKTLGRGG